jgi:hypothetical protein
MEGMQKEEGRMQNEEGRGARVGSGLFRGVAPVWSLFMRSFDSLTEKEVLALAISQEEEDAHIYDDFADGLKENYQAQAEKFAQMRREEDGHRHGVCRGAAG